MKTKTLDSRGRLCLGADYAGRLVIVEHADDGTIVVTPAVAVPIQAVKESMLTEDAKE